MAVKMNDFDALAACSGYRVAVDLETTGLQWFRDKPVGLGWYCPDAFSEGYIDVSDPDHFTEAIRIIRDVWDRETTTVICHNLKFDFHFMGIPPSHFRRLLDTTVLIHLRDSRYMKGLKEAEKTFLGIQSKEDHLESHGRDKNKIWTWPIEDIARYCVDDCRSTYNLMLHLLPQLKKLGLLSLLRDDMEYVKELWNIERHGMKANLDFAAYGIARLQEDIDRLEQELQSATGQEFNWRSAQQLSKALYEGMGIPKPKDPYADADGVYRGRFATRTKYNSTSTNTFILLEKVIVPAGWVNPVTGEVQEKESIGHPCGGIVSMLREARKLQNVLEKWPTLTDDRGYLHTGYNVTGTRTGRLSSSNPNLQNVPGAWRVKFTQTVFSGDLDRPQAYNLRKAIEADEGCVLVSIDWRQQELRMFGLLADDPNMVPALQTGRDIHSFVANQVWGRIDEFTRGMAKSITFGLIYGTSTASLSHRLNMTRNEAKNVTEQYWTAFPAIRPFRDTTVESILRTGYTRNWAGRYWWEEDREKTYKGVNFLVQGGAADQLKHAVLRCQKFFRETGARSHIVAIVHDELIFQMPREELWMVPDIVKVMEVEDIFGVPFPVDVEMGLNWGEKRKIPEEAIPMLLEGKQPNLPCDEAWKKDWERIKAAKLAVKP